MGSTSGVHAITVFCSWDHKVTQRRASRLQHDNIRTHLKVSCSGGPGAAAPTLRPCVPAMPVLACVSCVRRAGAGSWPRSQWVPDTGWPRESSWIFLPCTPLSQGCLLAGASVPGPRMCRSPRSRDAPLTAGFGGQACSGWVVAVGLSSSLRGLSVGTESLPPGWRARGRCPSAEEAEAALGALGQESPCSLVPQWEEAPGLPPARSPAPPPWPGASRDCSLPVLSVSKLRAEVWSLVRGR